MKNEKYIESLKNLNDNNVLWHAKQYIEGYTPISAYKDALDKAIISLSCELTDEEQRMFLSAMTKEEELCKDKYPDLLPLCQSIKAKVMNALF